jgi:hypothetical protein
MSDDDYLLLFKCFATTMPLTRQLAGLSVNFSENDDEILPKKKHRTHTFIGVFMLKATNESAMLQNTNETFYTAIIIMSIDVRSSPLLITQLARIHND